MIRLLFALVILFAADVSSASYIKGGGGGGSVTATDLTTGTTGVSITGGTGSVVSVSGTQIDISGLPFAQMEALTASRALQSNGSGVVSASSVTSTELGYVSGVTSAIQTQLNGKIGSLNGLTTTSQTFAIGTSGTIPAFSSSSSTHTLNIPLASASGVTRGTISRTQYDTFNGKQDAITGTTHGDLAYYNGSAWVRLAPGTTGQLLVTMGSGAAPIWATVSTTSGPVSTSYNAIALWDSTDGTLLANSDLLYSSRVLKLADDTSGGSGAAPDLTIQPAAKTSGTGNGGNLIFRTGTSSGGAYGNQMQWRVGSTSIGFDLANSGGSLRFTGVGSAAGPSYSWTGATSSGMYYDSPSSGPAISSGGYVMMYFQKSGTEAALQVGTANGTFIPNGADKGGLGYYSTNVLPWKYGFFGTGGIVIGATSGTVSTIGNGYHLKLHQTTAATAVYQQFVITTTTGTASGDGMLLGLDSSGNGILNQQENLPIKVFTNGTEVFQFLNTGGVFKNSAGANESTGAGSALLGGNSPASTLTAPYTWLKVVTSDGSTGYIPIWK